MAPIHRDDPDHSVVLPAGRWRHLSDDTEVLIGPRTLTRRFELEDFPVYVRDGAVLPLEVRRSYTGFGDDGSSNLVTWAVWPHGTHHFEVRHPEGSGRTRLTVESGSTLRFSLSGVPKPHRLRIHRGSVPETVLCDGEPLAPEAWHYAAVRQHLWITRPQPGNNRYEIR